MKQSRKIIRILCVLILALTLSACGEDEVQESEPTFIYSADNLPYEGYYVQKAEGYQPLMSKGATFSSRVYKSDPNRMIWYTDQDVLEGEIPVITQGDKLICLTHKATNLSDEIQLERFKLKGYTLGICFNLTSKEQKACFPQSSSDILETSSIYQALAASRQNPGGLEVAEFNEIEGFPVTALDQNTGILLGLQKDASYQLGYYYGTLYSSVVAKADTKVLTGGEIITINKIDRTKAGYAIIPLPEDLANGYYWVEDAGLFYYQGQGGN